VLTIIRTVRIAPDRLTIRLDPHGLAVNLGLAADRLSSGTAQAAPDRLPADPTSSLNEAAAPIDDSRCAITIPMVLRRRGPETRLVMAGSGGMLPTPEPDPVLAKAVAQAHRWWQAIEAGSHPTVRELAAACGKDERYIAQRLPLAFLSPRIVAAILDGRQPVELTAQELVHGTSLPLSWTEQERVLGFVP
jgi:site-specific DNA recombinase